VNIADRDYFRAHLAGGDRLAIGVPVRSRLDGRWVFAMSRPLLRDGRFAGTVHLTLGTEPMARQLAELELSAQDVVADTPGARAGRAASFNEGSMGSRCRGPPVRQPLAAGVYRVPARWTACPRLWLVPAAAVRALVAIGSRPRCWGR
jgi:hypothetical protein